MEINNLSLLTYGAIGATCVILAAITIFDSEAYGKPEEPGTDSMNMLDSLKSSFSANKTPEEPVEEPAEEPVEEPVEEPAEEPDEEPAEEEPDEYSETDKSEEQQEYTDADQSERDENNEKPTEVEATAPQQSNEDDAYNTERPMDKRTPGYGGKSATKKRTSKRTKGKQTRKPTTKTNKKTKGTRQKK